MENENGAADGRHRIADEALPANVDERSLRRMRFAADVLDDSVRVPGTDERVGLDPLLGLLPIAGDGVAAALSLYVVVEAALLGVSKRTLFRMLVNVGIDAGVGAIPVVGDAFDAVWKANVRNVELALRDLGVDPAVLEDPSVEIDVE